MPTTHRLNTRETGKDQGADNSSGPVVGVKSTRIYCRPICRTSRMPKAENCIPFPNAAAARAAGFRACKLCRPDDPVPPERLRRNATSETVRYGTGPTPIGEVFVALTDRGVCALFFPEEEELEAAPKWLQAMFPAGKLVEDAEAVSPIIKKVADWIKGGPEPEDVTLDLRGTDFQKSVWEALRTIPAGKTCTYGELARKIGNPKAARAVGAACGANPVSVFVPCHRAIGSSGALVNYRWGLDRKRALLDREAGRTSSLPLFSR